MYLTRHDGVIRAEANCLQLRTLRMEDSTMKVRLTVVIMTGVMLIFFAAMGASASGVLSADEMSAVHGGCGEHCVSYHPCGQMTGFCTSAGQCAGCTSGNWKQRCEPGTTWTCPDGVTLQGCGNPWFRTNCILGSCVNQGFDPDVWCDRPYCSNVIP
jgi:hypothetical protein